MRVYGLTGGIASGKSTVSELFRAKGAPVVDADVVARQVVQPGTPALEAIAARFPGVVRDGVLDRKALGARVFSDAAERQALNAIVHPRVREAVTAELAALAAKGHEVAIYDAPLLIENRLHEGLAGVVVVTVPLDVQRARLMARDGSTAAEADARIASQLPLAEKHRHATWLIDNGGSREATQQQVDAVWNAMQRAS
ncbi:MAG: dephospho-CoA kinase [Archangium sp.]|nr:dephospho-CoA kinase [Archangium sp.]